MYFPESFSETEEFSTSGQSDVSTTVASSLRAGVVKVYEMGKQTQLSVGVSVHATSSSDPLILPIEARIYPISDLDLVPLREAWARQWQPLTWISRLPSLIRVQTSTQTTADLPRCRQRSTAGIIEDLAANTAICNADRIASRLFYLAEVCREEAPEQAPISRASLHDLEGFLRSVPMLAYPSLVITLEGNIRAEWKGSPNKHLAIEFTGDQTVRFVIFVPDRQRPKQINRASGAAHIDSVLELLHPYGLSEWVLKKEPPYAQ